MKRCLFWLFSAILILANEILARPISYPGGWTIMQRNDFMRNSLHLHYTPSIKYSLGYRAEYWKRKKWQFHGVQLNYLINRSNTSKSQTNFYLKNGVGLAFSNLNQNNLKPNLFSGFSIDWEDRRFFSSYENRINYNDSIQNFFSQKVRLGMAPYIGKYGDLHTWLMLQVEHLPHTKDNVFLTPILRVFKGDYLFEAGINNSNKEFMFDFIKRF